MAISCHGRAPWRVIFIQLSIILGLMAFYKLYLPHRERDLAKQEVATREQRINALFRESVEEDSTREISAPLDSTVVKRHPQRLRALFSPEDAESTLGAPDSATSDFRGGQHLTWLGAAHKLEASFNAGRLYCLQLEDRTSGHGVMVFESYTSWHPY